MAGHDGGDGHADHARAREAQVLKFAAEQRDGAVPPVVIARAASEQRERLAQLVEGPQPREHRQHRQPLGRLVGERERVPQEDADLDVRQDGDEQDEVEAKDDPPEQRARASVEHAKHLQQDEQQQRHGQREGHCEEAARLSGGRALDEACESEAAGAVQRERANHDEEQGLGDERVDEPRRHGKLPVYGERLPRSRGLWPLMRPGAVSGATRALRCALAR
eukprot:2294416-Prymnesium_polylepis.1